MKILNLFKCFKNKNEEPDYIYVGDFYNETDKDITIFLEMNCEEIILSPGHKIRLMAENIPDVLPLDILYHSDGLQIYPKLGVPEWKFEYKGKQYFLADRAVLKDLDES